MIKIGLTDYTPENKIIDIRDKNQVIKAKYAIGKDDILKYTLMAEHYIEIYFELNRNASFKRSDYIEWEGDKYTLRDDSQPEQINKRKYKYTLKFEAVEMFFQDMQYWYLGQGMKESELRMTGNPEYFLKYAVENASRYFKTTEFNIGTVEPTEIKDITFEVNTNTFDALTQIADVYGAEWYITGKTIHLLNKVSFGDELDFETEVSVLSMKREEGESTTRYTRILALGSTRNIPYDYRETTPNEAVDAVYPKRLRIPANKGDVIDAYPNMSPDEVVEGTVVFDEVYPRREGTIEAVGTIEYQDVNEDTGEVTKWNAYKIKDSGINFKKEYLLPGQELKLQFISGDLNGRDFALIFHEKGFSSSDNSQFYEIVRTDEFGKLLPNNVMKPKAGDKYVLYGFNIALVSDQYVPAGELELYDVATTWQQKQLRDTGVYECPTVIKHFKDNQMDLAIGQKVRLIKDLGGNPNLCKNTNVNTNGITSYWGSWKSTFEFSKGNYIRVLKSDPQSTEQFGIQSPLVVGGLKKGKEYTVSFEIGSRYSTSDFDYNYIMSSIGNRNIGIKITISSSTTDLQYKYFTFKADRDYPDARIMIASVSRVGVSQGFTIRNFQVEEGNKASEWKPNIEEADGAIRSSRIMGFEKKLNNKFNAIYTVGDNSTYSRFGKIEQQIKELQVAGIVYESTGGNGVYVIKQFDTTRPTDFNVYSAIASDAKYFNKQTGGTVQGDTTFVKNMQVQGTAIGDVFQNSTFTAGQFGSGFQIKRDANGQSYMEVDNLLVRRETVFNRLTIAEIKSVGGTILLSLANMVLSKVEVKASTWKCFFDTSDGTIPNDYAVGDQAICRKFTGKDIKYYWALVTAVGADYIELSRTDKDGSGVPAIGDEVVQLGNRNNVNRQYAIMLSAYGSAAPSINQYAGINSYDLTGKEVTAISPKGNKFTGSFTVSTNGTTSPIYKERGMFVNGTVYYLDDRVSYLGSHWVCIVNTTITTPSEGSTTWRKETAGEADINNAVNNISVGGRNLLKGTSSTWRDAAVVQFGWSVRYSLSSFPSLQTGDPIAWSVEVDDRVVANNIKLRMSFYKQDGTYLDTPYSDVIAKEGRYSIVATIPKDTFSFDLRLFPANYKEGFTIGYRELQLEKGNKATDWNPAPEDINKAIQDAEAKAIHAQIEADKANSVISDIANDNKLTPNEKQIIAKDWGDIQKEYPSAISEANKFGVSTTAYTNAYNALNSYITPLLADLTTTNDIVGSTFRLRFNTYRDEYVKLLNGISTKAKALADAAQTAANNAQKEAEKVRTEYKADFVVLDTKIASKVSQTDFNALGNRVSTSESNIIQLSNQITSVVETVDNISVGGVNLCSNTDVSRDGITSAWVGWKGTMQYSKGNYIRLVRSQSTAPDFGIQSPLVLGGLKKDKEYTVSFEVGSYWHTSVFNYNFIISSVGNTRIPSSDFSISAATTDPQYKYFTFKADKDYPDARIMIGSSTGNDANPSQGFTIRKFQVEDGNKPTPWKPSQEDINKQITEADKKATQAQTNADAAQNSANNAQSAASKAQTDANTANGLLSDIANDNKLTPNEKQETKKEWDAIVSEYPKNIAQANKFSVSTTAYTNAYNALNTYITPLLASLGTTSDINGAAFRATFKAYYDARTDLLNAISTKAKELADAAQTTATDAQNTANLKNRTYYQDAIPTAPSGGHKVGDLWYKIALVDSSGNVNADTTKNIYQLQYRWDGTTWRQINWSVSRSKIEQTDSSISLIVEKTGLNSVGAGSSLYSMILQTEEKIVLEVSKVQVGGVNLCSNTDVSRDGITSAWIPWKGTIQHSKGNYLRLVRTQGTPTDFGIKSPLVLGGLKKDKEYTVSFEIGSRYSTSDFDYNYIMSSIGNRNIGIKITISSSTTDLQYKYFTFKADKDYPDARIMIGSLTGSDANSGQGFTIRNFQIEEGNKPTNWKPSQSDTQSGIDKAQNTADSKTTLDEVSSSLTITNNKISLASKTIELTGHTIAKSIEAQDLKVGSRTGLSALEVLKDGTFYVKGSTGSDSLLEIDSQLRHVKINSPITAAHGGDAHESSSLQMSSIIGGFEARSSLGVSKMSAHGVFSNYAGQGIFPLGRESVASHTALGFANLSVNGEFVAGVYGEANNRGSSPAYGGYFQKLQANGLYLNVRNVYANTYLDHHDVWVSCYNNSLVNVYLPLNPIVGQIIYLRQMNAGRFRVYTRNSQADIHEDGTIHTWINNRNNRGDTTVMLYDGAYWCLNYMAR